MVTKNSIIISLCYCLLYAIIIASYAEQSIGLIDRLIQCGGLFIFAIMIGCLSGGLIGSLLEYRIENMSTRKRRQLLLVCNLLSPILMYLLVKYPSEYLE